MKYRKKPVVIEAIQYDGKNKNEIMEFTEGRAFPFGKNNSLSIPTLEGTHECQVDDYVIRGVKGEFYPCKPDIFALTYDCEEDVEED